MKQLEKTAYKNWLSEIKSKLLRVQSQAALAVNSALISFYWDLGKSIVEKQEQTQWGDKLIEQLSKDLQTEFTDMKGLSVRNIKYCRQFYTFYQFTIGQQPVAQLKQLSIYKPNSINYTIMQQPVAQLAQQTANQPNSEEKSTIQQPVDQFDHNQFFQIPWGHNILIFTKSKNIEEAKFYICQTIENGWSRDTLAFQIKSGLFERQGKSLTNFNSTLPLGQSNLAIQTLKDPYIFDFLTLEKQAHERDIEQQLVAHVTKFLLELGKGFAFVGRQYELQIGNKQSFLDLLFYHISLRCYVVIDLKAVAFEPEFAGKMNYYLSAVDDLLKTHADNPTIGLILCKSKDKVDVEYALRDMNKPMGVSEYQLTEMVPEHLKSSLPTIEEIENELNTDLP